MSSAQQAQPKSAAAAEPALARKAYSPPGVLPQRSPSPGLGIDVSEVGAVQLREAEAAAGQPQVWENVDGKRIEDGRYAAFRKAMKEEVGIPDERVFIDPVKTFAYGTDASFYRLNPKVVIKVHNEDEVRAALPLAWKLQVPVTFRAAGTSLSGQALTDSVLLKLSHTGRNWRDYEVHGDGEAITVQPGLIGGEVNKILAKFYKDHELPTQYKIGPDPASIDSCMIGGIVSNNSSGMCCGVADNSYHTVQDMRLVFMDGTVLDTSDPASREAFLKSHSRLVAGVQDLAARVQADPELTALIKKKFAIKCTTGYSLNALVDFPPENGIEIIKRLFIGSEGTLGFVSQVTFNTVPEHQHKASAFVMFPDIESACKVAAILRRDTEVDAVELFDRASLREFEGTEEMCELVEGLAGCGPMAASLLIECRGEDDGVLGARIKAVQESISGAGVQIGYNQDAVRDVAAYPFHRDQKKAGLYWNARKGLIPIVGGAREAGTSMLIEDVACEVDKLGAMSLDLIEMFKKYEYHDATLFGHALEGNLHLVFSQGFRTEAEIERFDDMMHELARIVAGKYKGSLKAEHGTGRNMAPFVEMEWGTKAYEIMWELKELFDPDYILNPGVILNKDLDVHKKALKPSPVANDLVNRCIECGFCESNCPSRDITLTPRQRITVYREMKRLQALPARSAVEDKRLADFRELFEYNGNATCAADGMCQEKCPVKINTGELIKEVRAEELQDAKVAGGVGMFLANNFGMVNNSVPTLLNVVDFFHGVLGPAPLEVTSKLLNKVSGNFIPEWNRYMPKGAAAFDPAAAPKPAALAEAGIPRKVVYMPSCVTRMMGPARGDDGADASVHEKIMSILAKADYEVIIPTDTNALCCGMLFNSRGMKDPAAVKGNDLEAALLEASEGGKIPILTDTSPCLQTIKNQLQAPELRFSLYEPVEFINTFLLDKLEFTQVRDDVAIHVPCSSKKMGVESSFKTIAEKCAGKVHESGIPCCGMAGDRGMRYPELTGGSLQHLNPEVAGKCSDGYSTSRTCEMSLSNHSGVNFRGLVYLVDEATKPLST